MSLDLEVEAYESKMVLTTLHLHKEVVCKINVTLYGKCLSFTEILTYLNVKLGRSLTYHQHLESFLEELTSHIALMRQLAESGWCVSAAI